MAGPMTKKPGIWDQVAAADEAAQLAELKRIMALPSQAEVTTQKPYYPGDLFGTNNGMSEPQHEALMQNYEARGGSAGESLRESGWSAEDAYRYMQNPKNEYASYISRGLKDNRKKR